MNKTTSTRRRFLRTSAAATGGALMARGVGAAEPKGDNPPGRPNILFVLCDQWRAQALSIVGDPNIQTPNIDGLAREGVRFDHCVSNSPVCTPYRAQLMSGRFPTRTGVFRNNILLPPQEYCIAEAFGESGYETAYIGKWHLDGPPKPGKVEHRQGWQTWMGFNRGHSYFKGVYFTDSDRPISIPEGSFEPDHQTDLAIDYINRRTDTPWFLLVSFGGPHTPYTAPQNYLDQFNRAALQLRPNVEGDLARARKDLRGYYAHAKNLDDNVGRLLATLDEKGVAENTLVVFTSDHGDMHFSQGEIRKSKPWEESIGVPFIARWPEAVPPGHTVDPLFSTIDIYPTLCSLCGVPIPEGKDGLDRSGLFRNESAPLAESVYLSIHEPDASSAWRGVRTQTHTYAWRGVGAKGAPWVLYDNENDPFQQNNLAADSGASAIRSELHGLLLDWLDKVEDPFLT